MKKVRSWRYRGIYRSGVKELISGADKIIDGALVDKLKFDTRSHNAATFGIKTLKRDIVP